MCMFSSFGGLNFKLECTCATMTDYASVDVVERMGRKASKLLEKVKKDGVERRILMLGLDNAGKTTSLNHMKYKGSVNTMPTIGFNVETIEPIKGTTFMVWDIGGQTKVRQLWKHYCKDMAGLLFVVDCSDRERLWEARTELHQIITDDVMIGVPCIILANKQDMPDSMTAMELTEGLELQCLSHQHKWHVQSTCAIRGDGIFEAIVMLAKFIKGQTSDLTP